MRKISVFLVFVLMLVGLSACANKEEPVSNPDEYFEDVASDDVVSEKPAEKSSGDAISEGSVIGKWQTEDGTFAYEILEDGTLSVVNQNGTDDNCSWSIDENKLVFTFSDNATAVYSYDKEKDILASTNDETWYLVRSQE